MPRPSIYPQEVKDYIRLHYKGAHYRELADKVNATFGTSYTVNQIHYYCCRNKLFNGMPRSKCSFTKKPVGHEITSDGYVYVKTEELRQCHDGKSSGAHVYYMRNYKLKHRLVWEVANGPIPAGCAVIFLDGDKTNCALENLQLVTKTELNTMNGRHLRFPDPELTRTGALVAKAITTVKARKNNKNRKDESND